MVKKPFVAYGNKREDETNTIIVVRGKAPMYHAPYQQVAAMAPIQNQQPYAIPVDHWANQQSAPYQQQRQ